MTIIGVKVIRGLKGPSIIYKSKKEDHDQPIYAYKVCVSQDIGFIYVAKEMGLGLFFWLMGSIQL